MQRLIFFAATCFSLTKSSSASCETQACSCENSALQQPVCSKANTTFDSPCLLECAGAELACEHECPCILANRRHWRGKYKRQIGNCVCPKIHAPVCGQDGKDHLNACQALCAGTTIACSGKCPCSSNPCLCPLNWDPVCGVDGKTYSNACHARCSKVSIQCEKKCPCTTPCLCPLNYDPVCGVDGNTYGNSCQARCAKVKVNCEVECPCSSCDICPAVYDPVCGVDGQTYENQCRAICAKAQIRCKGECPCSTCTCGIVPEPVCGVDGTTYPCQRLAQCVGIDIKCKGQCPCRSCTCGIIPDPVCGVDGKTYGCQRQAQCAGIDVNCKGRCPCLTPISSLRKAKEEEKTVCMCSRSRNPVCGVDGKTYNNLCSAECHKAEVECYHTCPCDGRQNRNEMSNRSKSCRTKCKSKAKHVICGFDGQTYRNSCEAKCQRVSFSF